MTIRTETTTVVRGGQQIQTIRVFNNDTLVSTTVNRSAVAGFESRPIGAAIIGTGPEVPAGMGLDDSQDLTNGAAVAGSESAPQSVLAALGSLPATSTGAAGLGLAGLAITGLGLALLRRQPK